MMIIYILHLNTDECYGMNNLTISQHSISRSIGEEKVKYTFRYRLNLLLNRYNK